MNFMRYALKEAYKALKKDEVPVGAVIVLNGKIIATGYNQKETKRDSTCHAEIMAIRKASKKLGWRLNECDMYVTLEPCVMCAGAIINSRIRNLYIGTMDIKVGASNKLNIFELPELNHKVKVFYGILESECSEVLKKFFKTKRI